MPRRRWTNRQKLAVLADVQQRMDAGEKLRVIARSLGIQPIQLRKWRLAKSLLEDSDKSAQSLCAGRKSILGPVEEALIRWFFELREQGMAISVKMMIVKASELSHTFRRKSARAKDLSMRRFLKSHRITIRAATHESQRAPEEVKGEALDFISIMRPLVAAPNRHQDFVINMDQTPIFFTMTPSTTLEPVGGRSVHVRSSTSSTMRVTAAVTVTASGKILPTMLVFKGKPGGRIEKEFSTYPEGDHYSCQDRAWMDEAVMLAWVNRILIPYCQQRPVGGSSIPALGFLPLPSDG